MEILWDSLGFFGILWGSLAIIASYLLRTDGAHWSDGGGFRSRGEIPHHQQHTIRQVDPFDPSAPICIRVCDSSGILTQKNPLPPPHKKKAFDISINRIDCIVDNIIKIKISPGCYINSNVIS